MPYTRLPNRFESMKDGLLGLLGFVFTTISILVIGLIAGSPVLIIFIGVIAFSYYLWGGVGLLCTFLVVLVGILIKK